MRLLCLTDLHDQRSALERILAQAGPVDAVLLGGDITNFGAPSEAERIVREVQARAPRVLAVAGNCDSTAIEQRLVELGVSLFQRGLLVEGVGFQGLSAMPPWHPQMYQFTEEQLAHALNQGYAQLNGAQPHVVLSHPPPRAERVDYTQRGHHVGSIALREFIDRVQPSLVICGHIHEGRGLEQLGRTQVVNCGAAASGSFAIVEIGDEPRVELCQL
jgi:Icc-related predicted phosphoesterase